ncbi:LCP family protein [Pseudarthrobacter sp. Y6]|uniref:LCP family protein n=1 Tax=Pseudarthrobacter sp. Y6 TaxID=3418422 RepID=UPI003CE77E57
MVSTPSGPDPIGPASSGPEPAAPAAPKRRRVIAAVLTLVLVAVVAVSALLFSRPAAEVAAPAPTITDTATPTPSETTPPPAPAPPPPPEPIPELPAAPMNILVIGSDSRANAREQAAITAATGESQDHRADTLMLVHIPADRRSVHVVSLMRDLYVNIPDYGYAKINSSLQVGGIPLATRTVESLMETHIDHTLMLDFNGFKTLTDGLGGIDVNVTVPFQSTHETQHIFTAGVNRLDGQAALEFVRERYAFVDGDFQRVRNQQTFLRAILARLTSDGALNDVTAVRALVNFAGGYLTVDQGFDPVGVAILAYGMRGIDPNAVVTLTLPTAGAGLTAGGASVVFPDYGGIAQVAAAMREGRLPEYAGG